jgi:hypothetical protein
MEDNEQDLESQEIESDEDGFDDGLDDGFEDGSEEIGDEPEEIEVDNLANAVDAFLSRDPSEFQRSISAELDNRIQNSLDFQKGMVANNMVDPTQWQDAAEEQEETE